MERYDYVIVGSGVAGSTVAKSLLEANRNRSILILEAGPQVEAKNRRYWWDYVVRANGKEHRPYDFATDQPGDSKVTGNPSFLVGGSRLMVYGGSTVHWGGWCLRFKPEDFKLFTNTEEGGDWPLEYDELAPYYTRAEQHLSVCGDAEEPWNREMRPNEPYPMPPFWWTEADGEMIEAFRKNDIEPGKMPVARYRKCMTTGTCKYCPLGSRFSGQYVLDDLLSDRRNLNLEVRTNAPVTQVLLESRRRVKGVEYLDPSTGERHEALADTVLICAGAYESPKLLLQSTSSDWEYGIGNNEDLVGRFLVSHSMLKVRGRTNHNEEYWSQEYDFPTLMSRTYDTAEHQKKNKIFLFKNRALPNFDFAGEMIAGLSRDQIDAKWKGSREQELQAFMEEKGQDRNRIELARGTNRFGLPKMKINFDRTEDAQRNGQDWLKLMTKVVEDMGYDLVKREIQEPGGHHATGTCRMGETKKDGVTDRDMKVHGTDNLYVCSNAAFPSGSAVNPTLTLVAMAFRLADHLIGGAPGEPELVHSSTSEES